MGGFGVPTIGMSRSVAAGAIGGGALARLRRAVALWLRLFREHELLAYAGAIARTTLVAAVSLTLLTLGFLGAIGKQELWSRHVAPAIEPRVLPSVYAGIAATVDRIFAANSPTLILFAVVLAVWEVSGSVRGISGALNRIYETPERRSVSYRYPLSLALAAAVIVALLAALLLIMVAGGLVHGAAALPFALARWLAAVAILIAGFGLIVRFAPARPRAKKWASVGSGLVVAGWIVESLAFRWYVSSVADFRSAIGSLTVALVVVSYLYVGAIVLLVGIELDELLRERGEQVERTLANVATFLVRLGRR
jgi:YihY family inner membrane protein